MTMLLETPPSLSPTPVPGEQPKDALREAVRDLLESPEPAADAPV